MAAPHPAAPAPALRRLPDWPERLAGHIAQHRATPFAWGGHDCVRFAAGAVQATTGHWPLALQWPNAAAAARLLRQLGGLAAAVDGVLPRLATPALAQRGDILLVQGAEHGRTRQWLAVADAGGWWCPAATGLVRGRPEFAAIAWGVGHA